MDEIKCRICREPADLAWCLHTPWGVVLLCRAHLAWARLGSRDAANRRGTDAKPSPQELDVATVLRTSFAGPGSRDDAELVRPAPLVWGGASS